MTNMLGQEPSYGLRAEMDGLGGIVLIDAKNFVFRHHYPHSELKTEFGKPTSVLYGCLSGLLSLVNRLPQNTPIIFVWDGRGQTWRHKLLPDQSLPVSLRQEEVKEGDWSGQKIIAGLNMVVSKTPIFKKDTTQRATQPKLFGYKANRLKDKDRKLLALQQIPELRKVLDALGIRQFYIPNLEGDDLIGILSDFILQKKFFSEVIIHSTDRDFYQLLSPEVKILTGVETGKLCWVRECEVGLRYGVPAKDWLKYMAITGDHGDNIPSFMPGIGPVNAKKWLAIGVDASVKHYADISEMVRTQMTHLKAPKVGFIDWENEWPRLHRNYICCRILRDPQAEVLEKYVKECLEIELRNLGRDSFMRHPSGKSQDTFRHFREWLVKHQMADLVSRQEDFFKLV